MKKAIKLLFVAMLVVLMLVSVVACDNETPADPSNTGSNDNVVTDPSDPNATPAPGGDGGGLVPGKKFTQRGETYSFYSWQYKSESPYSEDTERDQKMRERIEALEKDHGITIEFVTSGGGSLLASAFQGVPEITGMKEGGLHTMMTTYLYNGNPGQCLIPLSDHGDVYNFRDNAKFNVESQYDLCEYNDKLWFFIPHEIGIHFECGGNALVFNKTLIKAAGYTDEQIYGWVNDGSWTWDKFEALLQATTIPDKGQYGIERGNEALVMWSLANSNGTEFVKKETNPTTGAIQDMFVYTGVEGDRLMEAYDEFIKFAKQGWMETTYYGSTSKVPLEHFLAGQVAFFYNGYSSNPLKDIAKAEFDYGIVPWPKGPSNVADANLNAYQSFYPHLNPYCVFRTDGNEKGAVQVLCELYTPIYDKDSAEAQALYESEKLLYSRDDESAKNIDVVENAKKHFRVFMYSQAPVSIGEAKQISQALFGKGEEDILNQTQNARTYFSSIAPAINAAIVSRSPYSWK